MFDLIYHGRLSYADWAMMPSWMRQDYMMRLNDFLKEQKRRQDAQQAAAKARANRH